MPLAFGPTPASGSHQHTSPRRRRRVGRDAHAGPATATAASTTPHPSHHRRTRPPKPNADLNATPTLPSLRCRDRHADSHIDPTTLPCRCAGCQLSNAEEAALFRRAQAGDGSEKLLLVVAVGGGLGLPDRHCRRSTVLRSSRGRSRYNRRAGSGNSMPARQNVRDTMSAI